jgi:hypothetical protein
LTIEARRADQGIDEEIPDDNANSKNGNGTDVTIHFGSSKVEPNDFTARFSWMLSAGWQPDEILFHEMVHAAADMNGVTRSRPLNLHFNDETEFIAIAVANF